MWFLPRGGDQLHALSSVWPLPVHAFKNNLNTTSSRAPHKRMYRRVINHCVRNAPAVHSPLYVGLPNSPESRSPCARRELKALCESRDRNDTALPEGGEPHRAPLYHLSRVSVSQPLDHPTAMSSGNKQGVSRRRVDLPPGRIRSSMNGRAPMSFRGRVGLTASQELRPPPYWQVVAVHLARWRLSSPSTTSPRKHHCAQGAAPARGIGTPCRGIHVTSC